MRPFIHLLLVTVVLVGAVVAPDRSPAADDLVDDASARVTGAVVVPAELEGFAGRTLELQLYKIHPQLADASADLVDTVVIEDFGHVQGGATRKAFEIGGAARVDPELMYYLTCFILDGQTRTHIGEMPDKNLCKVLTHGRPRVATFTVRPVR